MNKLMLCVYICVAISGTAQESKRTFSSELVKPISDKIRLTGRVKNETDSVTIYWPATKVLMRFEGQTLKALLKDERGKNYFNIIIDGDSSRYIRLDSTKRYYTLAENLSKGEHSVELIKRNEWDNGKTWFYGVVAEQGTLLPLPEKNNRVIEFFGNSITAGYAIEDYSSTDSPDSIYTNNYNTYAALTARHFNADLYCTVKSGIGITVSWFPLIMPEMYNRLDPADPTSKWNFSEVTPNIVVINLFQNDSWLIEKPDHPSFKLRFGKKPPTGKQLTEAYKSFVGTIRSTYPYAHIICALGNMDATREHSLWPGYISNAVEALHDEKIHTLFFAYMNKPGHPRREDNQQMATMLITFIEKNIKW